MAEKKEKKGAEEKKEAVKYPSSFGSHASMVQKELTEELQKQHPQLSVLEDENGQYVTETAKLDNHLSDTNRYSDAQHRKQEMQKLGIAKK